MADESSSVVGRVLDKITGNMRFPHLFLALLGLLAVDLIIPDPIPLLDEAALALLTLLVSRWPARREESRPSPPAEPDGPRDVTDRGATLD